MIQKLSFNILHYKILQVKLRTFFLTLTLVPILVFSIFLISTPLFSFAQITEGDDTDSSIYSPSAYSSDTEQIESYKVSVKVNTDASIDVEETILYNFGPNERHGIYRDIPIIYKTNSGRRVSLDLENIIVTDENVIPYKFTSSKNNNDRRIKIGDPDLFLDDIRTYVISYRVPNAIGFFDDFDEIYWNAIGAKWEVPIHNAEATVEIPFLAYSNGQSDSLLVKSTCYVGQTGSKEPCDFTTDTRDYGYPIKFKFEETDLNPHEGLTVAVGFPKGVVVEPPYITRTFNKFLANGWWWFLLPILVFILMYRYWAKYGKDPKGTGVIVAQYETPDNLSPMQIAFVLNQTFDNSLSAEIVYLATHGFLKISKIKKQGVFVSSDDYELEKLKEADETLKSFQTLLLNSLFLLGNITTKKVKLSDLKFIFYRIARKIEEDCETSLVLGGYFPESKNQKISNPLKSKGVTIAISILLAFFLGPVIGAFWGLGTTMAFVLSVVIWTIFRIIMPRMTEKGVLTKEYIKGFKLYLSVAEKDRIAFHNTPEKNPSHFEKFLPYAMSLGVEKEWAKVFEGINLAPPSWYNDSNMTSFSAGAFAHSMSSFSSMSSASLSSAPGSSSGSSGGGSSGGGGGGGGGGSW